MVRLSLPLLLALSSSPCLVESQSLDLSLDNSTGAFTVSLDGKPFLTGGNEYMANWKTASAGDLVQVAPAAPLSGYSSDFGASFTGTVLSWGAKPSASQSGAADGSTSVLMQTEFRVYDTQPGLITFDQVFPNEVVNNQTAEAEYRSRQEPNRLQDNMNECRVVTQKNVGLTTSVSGYSAFTPHSGKDGQKTGRQYDEHKAKYCDDSHKWAYTANVNHTMCQAKCDELSCTCFDVAGKTPTPAGDVRSQSIFPSFARTSPTGKDLDVFAYHGVFPSIHLTTLSGYASSSEGGAPVVVYDADDSELPMVVFSPVNSPKAQHMSSTGNYFGAGVKSRVEVTPAGWTQRFVLSAGKGIHDGMMNWGDRMLNVSGHRQKRANMYRDQTHSTIGFWTDNGGYYHYSTGTNKSATYEDVLPEVKKYHDDLGIPFGHWQFDSWFYPKDGGVNPGGGGGAVTNWTAMASVFPSGMAGIQEKLGAGMKGGMPTVMHNRQWSTKSDYIHNLSFPWYTSKCCAIPEDPPAFFDWFFQQQEGWGLSMYEQDWMCTEYDGVDALNTNISMGDLWLTGMAGGALKSGRTVQYCMPYPYDLLHAVAEPAVTNARATGDYFHAADQWNVANTALFYWPIGVLPFKDGFYSSNSPQIGGQTVGPETSPDREIIMATLSCAMVGPMDGIHLLNKTRVMASCRGDGLVLKPDQPVMTPDACFTDRNTNCYISHAYSDVASLSRRVHYVFSSSETNLTDAHFTLDASTDDYVVYNFYSKSAQKLAASNELEAGYEKHVYAIAAPVTGKLAFVGEPDKYTTASAKRFAGGVVAGDSSVTAQVTGSEGETVTVCAVRVADLTLVCETETFTDAGTKAVVLSA